MPEKEAKVAEHQKTANRSTTINSVSYRGEGDQINTSNTGNIVTNKRYRTLRIMPMVSFFFSADVFSRFLSVSLSVSQGARTYSIRVSSQLRACQGVLVLP